MRNFMDLSRALKGLADAFHTIKLKLDGLYDSIGAIGNKFELVETITLTEDVTTVEYSFTKPVSEFMIFINTASAGAVGTMRIRALKGENIIQSIALNNAIAASQRFFSVRLIDYKGDKIYLMSIPSSANNTSSAAYSNVIHQTDSIDKVDFTATTADVPIPQGSIITIYGIPTEEV